MTTDDSSQAASTFAVSSRPIVVVGGGVIGAACASALADRGCQVLLIDRAEFGRGCSHGNCGYVSPSHILPLCRPGMIGEALRTLFRRNSPLQLRVRLDLAQWLWFWRFARHCTERHMLAAGRARQSLLDSSRQLYQSFIDNGILTNCDWEARGLLFVHRSRKHFDDFAKTDELLRREFGLGAERLEETALLEREPALKPGIAGAWLYECDAHLRSDKLMQAWKRRLIEQGVTIRENCELIHVQRGDGLISAIQTSTGRIELDQLVIATGAWTRILQSELGTRVPIEPGKGYSITMRRPVRCPVYPMIFEEDRVAITPFASGYRIGSTMEFAGFSRSLKPERLQILIDGAKRYLHDPVTEPFLETWFGWRPMSCDGVPMIGRIPKLENAWIAAGHSMLGLSMAPGTGRLLAELLTGETPHVDPTPFRLDRF